MNTILFHIVLLQIKHFTAGALTTDEVTRIKDFILSLENKEIDAVVKHQQTADLIKSLAGNLTGTTIDWIVKTLLLFVRDPSNS